MGKFDRKDPALDATDQSSIISIMNSTGWSEVAVVFDTNLLVWRASGMRTGVKHEARGSTKELALNLLNL